MVGPLRCLVVMALLLGVAGCAPASPPPAPIAPAAAVEYGVIVAIRPAVDGSVEFVLRDAGGRILSVVQANDEKFRPGERVVLMRGARTRITRPPG